MNDNEARARILAGTQLTDQGWNIHDANAVRYEVAAADGGFADYVLYDRRGRPLVIEAKRFSIDPDLPRRRPAATPNSSVWPTSFWPMAAKPSSGNGGQKPVPAGQDLLQAGRPRTARPRSSFAATRRMCPPTPASPGILPDCLHRRPVPRDRPWSPQAARRDGHRHRQDAHCSGLHQACSKPTASPRCSFWWTATLAIQTIDALTEHLPDYPAYIQRSGQRFQDHKRITVTTLQSMVNIYRDYSPGYFDLIISDECHRSIYGKWSGGAQVLRRHPARAYCHPLRGAADPTRATTKTSSSCATPEVL